MHAILVACRAWAGRMVASEPQFFSKLVDIQSPEWLW